MKTFHSKVFIINTLENEGYSRVEGSGKWYHESSGTTFNSLEEAYMHYMEN